MSWESKGYSPNATRGNWALLRVVNKTFLRGEGGIGGVSLDSDDICWGTGVNEVFLSYNDSGTVTGGFPVLPQKTRWWFQRCLPFLLLTLEIIQLSLFFFWREVLKNHQEEKLTEGLLRRKAKHLALRFVFFVGFDLHFFPRGGITSGAEYAQDKLYQLWHIALILTSSLVVRRSQWWIHQSMAPGGVRSPGETQDTIVANKGLGRDSRTNKRSLPGGDDCILGRGRSHWLYFIFSGDVSVGYIPRPPGCWNLRVSMKVPYLCYWSKLQEIK